MSRQASPGAGRQEGSLAGFSQTRSCLSCGGTSLSEVLDLGEQPLANSYRDLGDPSPEQRFPLGLLCCHGCSLVQLTGTVPPGILFDEYPYFSSYSVTMVDAMRHLARRVVRGHGLSRQSLVVDIGANDGYLLRHYIDFGVKVLGVEPAHNVAERARDNEIPVMVRYFGAATAAAIISSHGPADIVHANNVMAHVPDINDFTAGLAKLLAKDGTAFVESPYVACLVANAEFDTVYHEHVFYYSLTAMDALLRRHGLAVADVESLPVHGGSLRFAIRRLGAPASPAVTNLLAEEATNDIGSPVYYDALSGRVDYLKRRNLEMLRSMRAQGALLAAYGAAAKATILLNHFGIGPDLVPVVYDRNPAKQGKAMPGVHIPIADPAMLSRQNTSHLLLLAWNLADEIMTQQAAYRQSGGKFMLPLPEPTII
jgi:SAM-dependent methyltransferase